jgi:hypothetical protein
MRVIEIIKRYPEYFTFDLKKWLATPGNVLYQRQNDLAFAESKPNGLYFVHMCFHTSRGKDAVVVVNTILKEFSEAYKPKVIVGLVHKDNTAAAVVLRKAGWVSLGHTETHNGLCQIFTPIKDD